MTLGLGLEQARTIVAAARAKAAEQGFAPLTVGLILATSLVMSRAADHDWRAYLVTAICTLIFVRTKLNPLIVVAAAGALGYFGIL